ncbi:peptidoglycan-binding protein [Pelagibius litoralis]|uniref:Peptidoglycan-binding protein n=2 Tax=Pelagibius litoralis TaxID=374515 RepID=A0A967F1N3_9PROT|nr:peptidoglycan-binding protein [Pelagibius litoralis]
MRNVKHMIIGSSVLLLGACSATTSPDVATLRSELETSKQELGSSLERNAALEEQLAGLKQQGPKVEYAKSGDLDLPPKASAGECYARVFVPPQYRKSSERILAAEASERIDIIPAKYGWVEEQVLVKEASERVEVVPATYKTVQERVLVSEASTQMESVPAIYETVSERVLVKPAYTTWKKGRGPIERINEATGEIMCLVEVPAEYRTVSKQVLKTAAGSRSSVVPAQYKTVTKQVVATPATTRMVKVPAQYDTVRVRKLLEPSKEKRLAIPAQYQTVSKTEKVTEGNLEWRPILCETNVTPGIVTRIQNALLSKGYNPGRLDGVIGSDTMSAVQSFQKAKGLASGQLTMETLKALGVSLSGTTG